MFRKPNVPQANLLTTPEMSCRGDYLPIFIAHNFQLLRASPDTTAEVRA